MFPARTHPNLVSNATGDPGRPDRQLLSNTAMNTSTPRKMPMQIWVSKWDIGQMISGPGKIKWN